MNILDWGMSHLNDLLCTVCVPHVQWTVHPGVLACLQWDHLHVCTGRALSSFTPVMSVVGLFNGTFDMSH